MSAYIAKPKEVKQYAAIIVIYENRGLTTHIQDVARRAAKAGYFAIAPDALSAVGIKPANEDEARGKFQTLKPEDSLQNFLNISPYWQQEKISMVKQVA